MRQIVQDPDRSRPGHCNQLLFYISTHSAESCYAGGTRLHALFGRRSQDGAAFLVSGAAGPLRVRARALQSETPRAGAGCRGAVASCSGSACAARFPPAARGGISAGRGPAGR